MSDHELLGGLAPAAFLKTHWQIRWRLVRQAIPGFTGLVTLADMRRLAARDDVESRLVVRDGRRWSLEHGPFPSRLFRTLPARNWTLLVQGMNMALPEADRLMRRFEFIPFARLDDLMVSYAAPGGGVGPHCDSYDVFLLQGFGRRRWRIGRQRDKSLRPGLPVRILSRFRPTAEWVLEPGDMLYLPPDVAHDGVALDACTTYSIGFRAPRQRELASRFFESLAERWADETGPYAGFDRLYTDRGLGTTVRPARIPDAMIDRVGALLEAARWRRADVAHFLGAHLTEPKANVVFDPPESPLPRRRFDPLARRHGVALDLRTGMLYCGGLAYVNGLASPVAPRDREVIARLADRRRLEPEFTASPATAGLLHDWYSAGYLHLRD